jgi:hypothetical protein
MSRLFKLTEKFGNVMGEIVARGDTVAEEEYWRLHNVINGAAMRLGLPHEQPVALLSREEIERLAPEQFE